MTPSRTFRDRVENILRIADVQTDGSRPWDILIHDDRFYAAVLTKGALGMGESYVEGWWDCEELPQLFCRLLKAHLERKVSLSWKLLLAHIKAELFNRQAKSLAARNAHRHYDLGNDLYINMLGSWMLYSSANWEHATSLDEAGEAKFDFICRRLGLLSGQRILDIGCGWGGFAKYAAQKYGVAVVGITVSAEQARLARQLCSDLPVEIRFQDYRDLSDQDLSDKFDHVVSLGMFEHVGYKNYRRYMEIVQHSLKAGGLFFLNTIGANESRHHTDAWTDKYIFPGGMLPSIAQIGAAIDGLFVLEELHDWANFYDKTLMSWFERFNRNWDKLRDHYSERFYRMWKYYLLSSAGAFRAKTIQDWQMVFSY